MEIFIIIYSIISVILCLCYFVIIEENHNLMEWIQWTFLWPILFIKYLLIALFKILFTNWK